MATRNEEIILGVKLDVGQSVQDAAQLRDELIKLKEAQSSNSRETDEQKLAYEQNEAAIKSLQTQLRQTTTLLSNNETAIKANDGSFNKLYNQWKIGEAQLKSLTGSIKKNEDGTYSLTQEYFNAKKGVDDAKQALLSFNAGIAQGNLNVGNYDNTLTGMRQKLADLQIVLQNTDVGSKEFAEATEQAAKLGFEVDKLSGKIDDMGNREARNPVKRGFDDAIESGAALTSVISTLSIAFAGNEKAGEGLKKVLTAIAVAQTAATVARSKAAIVDTAELIWTKAQTAATWLYEKAIKSATAAQTAFKATLVGLAVTGAIIAITRLIDAMKSQTDATQDAIDKKKEYDELNKKASEDEIQRILHIEAAQLHLEQRIKNINEQESLGNDVSKMKIALAEDEIKALQNVIAFEDEYSQKYKDVSNLIFEKQLELNSLLSAGHKTVKDQAKNILDEQLSLIENNKEAIADYINDLTEKYKGLNVEYAELRDEDYENLKAYLEKLRGAESLSRGNRRDDAHHDAEITRDQEREDYDARQAAYQEYLNKLGAYSQEFGDKVGIIFGESLQGAGLDLEKFSKGVTLLILDQLKKTVQASIAEITATQIAQKGFIGIITGGLLSAAVSVAFETAKAAINSSDTKFFYEGGEYGGYTGDGDPRKESKAVGKKPYVYHNKEYIVDHKTYSNPFVNKFITDVVEPMRKQNKPSGIYGYYDGGFASNFSKSIQGNQNGLSLNDIQQLKLFVSVTDINNMQNSVMVTDQRGQL